MVTVGGGDHGALASNIVRWCIAAAPEAAIEVVVGPFSGHSDDLRAIAERTAQVVILEQPDMREAMLRADVGVSAGGQTLFELAVTGLPAIVIAMAANQKQNVADFAAAGTIRSAGEHDMPRLASRFAAAFEEVRSAEVRRDMSRRGLNLVDGRGAERTASSIAMLLRDSRSAIG